MASSKPKKGFSMSLGKPKIASSSSGAASKGGDRVSNGGNSKQASAIGVSHDDDDNDGGGKRDYVTGIGGGKVVTKEVVVERGPRVISLVSNPWAKGSNSSSSSNGTTPAAAVPPHDPSTAPPADEQPPAAVAEKSLDQLAAEAIAQESLRGDARGDGGAANGYGLGLDSDRVIGMLGGGTGAETTQAGSAPPQAASTDGGSSSKKRTGLLEQNMIPGIMDVDGEDAKFKHDLGHRAEDLSARSKAYVDVPVAEFGAALLRGMGWTGPDGDGGAGAAGSPLPTDIEPRHHRLGLGAQPKPPEEMKRPRKRKPGEKPRASDAQRLKIWEQKVQEERAREASKPAAAAAAAKLSVMDVVELSEGAGGEGRRRPRAMVLKTQGVPGLNKISVRLEDTGEKVIVDKSSATRVSEDDLARRPFSESRKNGSFKKKSGDSHAADEENGGKVSRNGSRNGSGKKRSRSRSRSRSVSSGSSGRGGSVERDGYNGRDPRDGGEKKSKKDKKQKKHKKSSKREQRRNSSAERSPSPRRNSSNDLGDRDTERRRQADRGGDDRRTRRAGDDRKREDPPDNDDDVDRKRRRRDASGGDRNGGNSDTATIRRKNDNDSGRRSDSRERQPEPSEGAWLRANIRVRVVHKSYAGGRAYLGKGRVVDVPRIGQATVRMDLGELVLEGVKERHLETVLPARGGKVIVVRGEEKGATGKLLAKNKEKETALVQVYEDLRAITLSLDDVAEFTGMLDEDMDDVGY